MGSLLTLAAPAFPFVCCTNESAALVLLPVSAARVAVGEIVVGVTGDTEGGEGGLGDGLLPPHAAKPEFKIRRRPAGRHVWVRQQFMGFWRPAPQAPEPVRCFLPRCWFAQQRE